MRNARILARMVASTLAAAVMVAGMATAASATPHDTGWKVDAGAKHLAAKSDTGWRTHELETRTLQSAPRRSVPAIPQAVSK